MCCPKSRSFPTKPHPTAPSHAFTFEHLELQVRVLVCEQQLKEGTLSIVDKVIESWSVFTGGAVCSHNTFEVDLIAPRNHHSTGTSINC